MAEIKTYTFRTHDGLYQFTVMEDFVKKFGFIVETEDVYNLMTKYKLTNYLHNDDGPAILYLQPGVDQKSYWLNGKEVTEDDIPRLKHNKEFNNGLEEILGIK